ncbi:MAG: DUF4252 domain-containing protein [Candidatus Omnitrophica bacterium]|nr:DUF4252 domain-containing protein [Candidatus Omnitrophota bacterium]
MKWIGRVLIGFSLLCAASLAVANEGLKEHPGYVDVDIHAIVGDVQPNVEVFLEKPLLRMLMGAATEVNPEIADLIGQIDLIQVKVFEDIKNQPSDLLEKVSQEVARLKSEGWSQVVRVPEEGESVDVLMKSDDDNLAGLAVFVAEEDEWVFVNLVGMINPELFGKLLAKLGPQVLEGDVDLEDLGEALGFQASEHHPPMVGEREIEEVEIYPPEVELSREQIEPLVGTYMIQSGEEAGNSIHIEIGDDGQLFGHLESEPKSRLHAINETTFVAPDLDAAVEFKMNDEGEVTSLTVKIDDETVIANKV